MGKWNGLLTSHFPPQCWCHHKTSSLFVFSHSLLPLLSSCVFLAQLFFRLHAIFLAIRPFKFPTWASAHGLLPSQFLPFSLSRLTETSNWYDTCCDHPRRLSYQSRVNKQSAHGNTCTMWQAQINKTVSLWSERWNYNISNASHRPTSFIRRAVGNYLTWCD